MPEPLAMHHRQIGQNAATALRSKGIASRCHMHSWPTAVSIPTEASCREGKAEHVERMRTA